MQIPSLVLFASLSTLALLAGSAPGTPAPRTCCSARAEPSSGETPLFDRVRELTGTWVAVDGEGRPTQDVVSRYASTAGGSAVIESLFPGTEQEMVSLYHADGEALFLEHFCVLGSHPRMRAAWDAKAGELVFTCTGEGLNFRSCAQVRHMHEGRIRRVGSDRLESTWTPWNEGRPEEAARFSLARVSRP
jgi:hypothetical protein